MLDSAVLIEVAPESPKGTTVAIPIEGEEWKHQPGRTPPNQE
jgi:hypothetical protein